MVAAINCLRDKVRLRIVGDVFGEERRWLNKEIEAKKLDNSITITGWLPYEKINETIKECHVGFNTL